MMGFMIKAGSILASEIKQPRQNNFGNQNSCKCIFSLIAKSLLSEVFDYPAFNSEAHHCLSVYQSNFLGSF